MGGGVKRWRGDGVRAWMIDAGGAVVVVDKDVERWSKVDLLDE